MDLTLYADKYPNVTIYGLTGDDEIPSYYVRRNGDEDTTATARMYLTVTGFQLLESPVTFDNFHEVCQLLKKFGA